MLVNNPYLPCDRQDIDNIDIDTAMEEEGLVPKSSKPKKAPKKFKKN